MISPSSKGAELITGMKLELDEFLTRWEALPGLKNAELIEGVVYVSSSVGQDHGRYEHFLSGWLWLYAEATLGCDSGNNVSCTMLGQSPQPEIYLRIAEGFGGKLVPPGKLLAVVPELVVEISVTSGEIDLGPKLALYRRAGVQEYITIQALLERIVWRVLEDGRYRDIQPDSQGILRSKSFPGLWLDTAAYWAGDRRRMRQTLNLGLETVEHQEFVELLRQRAK